MKSFSLFSKEKKKSGLRKLIAGAQGDIYVTDRNTILKKSKFKFPIVIDDNNNLKKSGSIINDRDKKDSIYEEYTLHKYIYGKIPNGIAEVYTFDEVHNGYYMKKYESDLFDKVKNKQLSLSVKMNIILRILEIFEKMHEYNFYHRDIKTENILMNDNVPYICDFGLSTRNKTDTKICGTLAYICPDMLDKKIPYECKKVDIWQLGVLIFEILNEQGPFKTVPNVHDNHIPVFYTDKIFIAKLSKYRNTWTYKSFFTPKYSYYHNNIKNDNFFELYKNIFTNSKDRITLPEMIKFIIKQIYNNAKK